MDHEIAFHLTFIRCCAVLALLILLSTMIAVYLARSELHGIRRNFCEASEHLDNRIAALENEIHQARIEAWKNRHTLEQAP